MTKDEINKKYPKRNNQYYIRDNDKDYVLPAVTDILSVINKPALITWAGRLAAKIALAEPFLNADEVIGKVYGTRNKAADVGKTIHSLIHSLIENKNIDVEGLPKEIEGYARAFLGFYYEHRPKFLKTEQTVYSIDWGFAGTLDLIMAMKDGSVWVVDIKTGKGIYREFELQLCAYAVACEEMRLATIDHTGILHLKPDRTYSFVEVKGDFEVFKAVKKLHEWVNKKEG